jgi:hypothetical protein
MGRHLSGCVEFGSIDMNLFNTILASLPKIDSPLYPQHNKDESVPSSKREIL